MALKYSKTSGFATTQGPDFEVTLAALLFIRGLNSGHDFQLGTNVKGAGAMDDIVFRFKCSDEPDTCWTTLFVQLKHTKSWVSKQMLMNPKGDFSLPKYFKSYLEIKKAMLAGTEPLFNGNVGNCLFVIFTNARSNETMGEGRCENLSKAEKFLWTDSGSIFSFKEDKEMLTCLPDSGYEGDHFLSRLLVFSDQPSVIRLKAAVRDELDNMTDETFHGVGVKRLCDAFLDRIKAWGEKSTEILHRSHNLLHQAVEQNKLESSCQKTLMNFKFDVDFDDASLLPLRKTLRSNLKVIVFDCDQGSFRLNFTKLVQAIGGQAIVLDYEGLLANKKALLAQCQSGDFKSLVICVKDWRLGDVEKYCEVVKEICEIQTASSVWNIVFMSGNKRMGEDISEILPKCEIFTDESFLFSQLCRKSQELILSKKIKFQGRNLNFKQILSSAKENIDERLDKYLVASSVVEILESKGSLSVWPALPQSIGYYIDRSLEQTTVVKASVFLEDTLRETVTVQVIDCNASTDLGHAKQKSGEYLNDPNFSIKNGLFEKAIHFLSSLKESQSMNFKEEKIVLKLTQSPLVPDLDDVFIGPKFPLGLFECNSVGLKFGQESTVTALQVRTSKLISRQASFLFVSDKTNEKDIKKLSDFLHSKHLLSLEGGQLRWVRSCGDINSIRPHINEDQVTQFAPETAMDVEERLVLVCAEPGMGKSTLMTRLANNTKEAFPHYFVILISLNNHSQLFAQGKHVDALDFLSSTNKGESHLQKSILKHTLEVSGNVILLFDGFDEIAPTYVEQSCELISSLLKRTKASKIWLASRNSLKHTVENHFFKFSVKLRKFHVDDQRCFLRKLWKEKSILNDAELSNFIDQLLQRSSLAVREVKLLNILPISNKMKQTLTDFEISTLNEITAFRNEFQSVQYIKTTETKFAYLDSKIDQWNELLEKISQAAEDEQKNFLGIPLQTQMLAEVYEDHVTSAAKKPKLPESLDLLELLEKFVKKKCSIFVQAKLKILANDTNYKELYSTLEKQFIERHLKASLVLILGHDDIKILGMEKIISESSEFFQKIQNAEDKTGFIDYIVNDMPHFVHRVFAEYFVAKWISEHFSDNRKLITSKIFTDNFAVVRNILDRILCRGFALHTAVLDEDFEGVKTLLESEDVDVEAKNGGAATALHLAASRGTSKDLEENKRRSKILDLLIGKTSDFDQADSVLGGSPLQYADFTQSWIAIDKLLPHTGNKKQLEQTVATVTNNDMLDTIFNLDLANLLNFCFDNGLDVEHCSEGESRLILRACEKGSVKVVSLLIARNANINQINTDEGDRSPLQIASTHGHRKIVKLLCQKNESTLRNLCHREVNGNSKNYINFGNNYGMTAIHYAAMNGHYDVISLLINQGGDPQSNNCDNCTPLCLAATFKHARAVRVLLAALDEEERVAAVNLCDKDGKSVLHYGTYGGCVECVELLVQAGGKLTQMDNDGFTLLMGVPRGGNQEIVCYLLNNFNAKRDGMNKLKFISMRGKNGFTAMHYAAARGHSEILSVLISQGGDPQSHDDDSCSPLHFAAQFKHAWAVRVLLAALDEEERAAAINSCGNDGKSVLLNGANGGCVECVELLVQAGGKLTQLDNSGFTPLMAATHEGHQKVITYLLNNFNDGREGMSRLDYIKIGNEEGFAAIHIAAQRGHSDIISLLISEGIEPQSRSCKDVTPLHLAAVHKQLTALRVLLRTLDEKKLSDAVNSCASDGKTVLHYGVLGGCVKCVELLVQAGGKLTQASITGFTPLMAAASVGNQDVVCYLWNSFNEGKEGMNKLDYIHMADNLGETAMHYAAGDGHSNVLSFLINQGGNPASRNHNRAMPVHFAAFKNYPSAVRVLLEAMNEEDLADINMRDNEGRSLLYYAVEAGYVECVELLVQAGAN